ncbi:peptidylprolyl isomerase [Chondrinema litorale]|uniref:peptidylprolyl isomerase n=1 Tax=Chondrinema litorale TaxID=2994555 RepID=UPI002543676B|nr:peptidylprolyl isomerase [Chondrinema litorale]UZR94951.1 peptidylprolyl isomerase [Chondrinema litorale]
MKKVFVISILTLLLFPILSSNAFSAKPPKKSYVAKVYTKFGTIHLLLYDETPLHRDNFVKLINEQFYDSTTFHRVLIDFMIQGGDPNSKLDAEGKIGTGGPGYTIDAEIVDNYKHNRGKLAAARLGDKVNPDKKSSGSQFYIVQSDKGAHHLDGGYTIFGTVLKGLNVVDEIAEQQVDGIGKPKNDIRMSITVSKIKRKKITKIYDFAFD